MGTNLVLRRLNFQPYPLTSREEGLEIDLIIHGLYAYLRKLL